MLETDAAIAEALLAAGDWSAAADLADDGAVRAEALGAGYLLPVLDRLHGVALLRLGDLDGARERLERALAQCDEQAPTERGFVLADLAEVADAGGDRTAATEAQDRERRSPRRPRLRTLTQVGRTRSRESVSST